MKKITNVGNLPESFQILLNSMGGAGTSAEIWECESVKELQGVVKDKKAEETQIARDPKTNRCYMTAFTFKQDQIIKMFDKPNNMLTMVVYFTEMPKDDVKRYQKMLKKHRTDQQDDMINRQERKKVTDTPKNIKIIKGK